MIEIPSHFWLDQRDTPFPDLSLALKEPNGLIAIGGDLSIERLLDAYSKDKSPPMAIRPLGSFNAKLKSGKGVSR